MWHRKNESDLEFVSVSSYWHVLKSSKKSTECIHSHISTPVAAWLCGCSVTKTKWLHLHMLQRLP